MCVGLWILMTIAVAGYVIGHIFIVLSDTDD